MSDEAGVPTFELQVEAWGKTECLPELIAALAKAQLEFAPVVKKAENPAFKRGNKTSKYADLSECIDATRPALSKYGLAIVQLPSTDSGAAIITSLLLHESGAGIKCVTWLPVSKFDAHGIGGGYTYARRYAYSAMLSLGAEDDDGNAATGKSVESEQLRGIAADILKQSGDSQVEDMVGVWYRMKDPLTEQVFDVFAPHDVPDSTRLLEQIGKRAIIKATEKTKGKFLLESVVGVRVADDVPQPLPAPKESPQAAPGAKKGQSAKPADTKKPESVTIGTGGMNIELQKARRESKIPDEAYYKILKSYGVEHGPDVSLRDFNKVLKDVKDYGLFVSEQEALATQNGDPF